MREKVKVVETNLCKIQKDQSKCFAKLRFNIKYEIFYSQVQFGQSDLKIGWLLKHSVLEHFLFKMGPWCLFQTCDTAFQNSISEDGENLSKEVF